MLYFHSMKNRTLLLFAMLTLSLHATAQVVDQYPRLPPEPKPRSAFDDFRETSILPREWQRNPPRPLTEHEKLCRIDVIQCTANKIVSTPTAAFRRSMRDYDRRGQVSNPLPYAQYLQRFMHNGFRAGVGYCAKGVRLVLEAARFVPIPSANPRLAKHYYDYLMKHDFVHNWTVCRSPGAIRVYGGATLPAEARRRGKTAGDDAGHVEIVDINGNFQSFFNTDTPAHEDKGEWRRPLIACMMKKAGTYEHLLSRRGSR